MSGLNIKFVSVSNIKDQVTQANPSPIRMVRYSEVKEELELLRTQLADATRKLEEVKAAFYVNMLKCYPEKSHAEIQEAVYQAIEQGAPSL